MIFVKHTSLQKSKTLYFHLILISFKDILCSTQNQGLIKNGTLNDFLYTIAILFNYINFK